MNPTSFALLALLSFNAGWFPSGGASSPGMAYDSNWERIFSLDYLHHLALPHDDEAARKLAARFHENFKQYADEVDADIGDAGPRG